MKGYVGVRVSEQQRERLEELAKEAGMTLSQLFRLLVDNAEMVSKPVVKATIEANSRVDVRQDNLDTAAASPINHAR